MLQNVCKLKILEISTNNNRNVRKNEKLLSVCTVRTEYILNQHNINECKQFTTTVLY